MFGKPVAVPMESMYYLLHEVGSVIPAVFMFMAVSPTCHRYEPILRNFDALMTIDLGAMCWAVTPLVAMEFFYLQKLVRTITCWSKDKNLSWKNQYC